MDGSASAGRSPSSRRASRAQRPPYVDAVFARDDLGPALAYAAPDRAGRVPVIPGASARAGSALGAPNTSSGDVPYRGQAWAQVERGLRPERRRARRGVLPSRPGRAGRARDEHGASPAAASCLDPSTPAGAPRRSLGLEPASLARRRFAVALTHDVDVPWRWAGRAVRGSPRA